ncbi:MAG: ABC transporter permease [Chloroflexi bacterium]|nr:ABC transporter permease [Chloroflexota bacterium]
MIAELDNVKEEEKLQGRSPTQDALREFRRNRAGVVGLVFILGVIIVAVFAPAFTPYNPEYQNIFNNRAKPMTAYDITTTQAENCHWYGTPLEFGCMLFVVGSDSLGRDTWSRMIYGTRVSLAVAVVGAGVAFLIGLIYGTISGYAGGAVDNVMMRIVDFMYAIPGLPIIILVSVYFKALTRAGVTTGFAGFLIQLDQKLGGVLFVFMVIGALSWIGLARMARGQVLSYKNKEFVEAAKSMGAPDSRIIFKHLVPNIIGPLLISESLAIPGYIFTEAFLSFIGLGVNPPTPSWGAMISAGLSGIRSSPQLVLVPGIALVLTTLAFNFMGDGLRDAFDPRMRGKN